jgi:CheY-like chemotaxis protein/anti-sigma regulatory factor (Ser/Thr protein kinase)
LPDDLWFIDADKGQISQVIQNIVINASHSMPGGGIINIGCTNIKKEGLQGCLLAGDTDYVQITIADNGVGIPARILGQIFDPYYSTKKEGSGLGLAISQSIINKHKGQISVISEPGSGTVFTIHLPATSTVAPHKPKVIPMRPVVTVTAKILVMDDEQMILDVASHMLLAMGHEVITVRDGDECIRIYKAQTAAGSPPDLIITDLTIPGAKGGLETIAELLLINPQIKVLVSSGYSSDPVMALYRKYGFVGAIPKPYIMEDMAKTIEEVLQ